MNTKERWEMYDRARGIGIRLVGHKRVIAYVPPGFPALDHARKIAAAPAMLSLLGRMHEDITNGVMPGSLGSLVTMVELDAVILEARGE